MTHRGEKTITKQILIVAEIINFDAAGKFLERGEGERGDVTQAERLVRPHPLYVLHSATEGKKGGKVI